jgi:hypothetical protein
MQTLSPREYLGQPGWLHNSGRLDEDSKYLIGSNSRDLHLSRVVFGHRSHRPRPIQAFFPETPNRIPDSGHSVSGGHREHHSSRVARNRGTANGTWFVNNSSKFSKPTMRMALADSSRPLLSNGRLSDPRALISRVASSFLNPFGSRGSTSSKRRIMHWFRSGRGFTSRHKQHDRRGRTKSEPVARDLDRGSDWGSRPDHKLAV